MIELKNFEKKTNLQDFEKWRPSGVLSKSGDFGLVKASQCMMTRVHVDRANFD